MLNTQFVNKPTAEEMWHLSKESVEDPKAAICRFYDTYGLAKAHERLWEMVRITLISREINDWNEIQRSNLLYYYELLADLLKSNYILFLKTRQEA